MVRLPKPIENKAPEPRAETPMEKTTRAVTKIIDTETEQRQTKTARLRKARLEQEANLTAKAVPPKAKVARKKAPLKSAK